MTRGRTGNSLAAARPMTMSERERPCVGDCWWAFLSSRWSCGCWSP